MVEVRLRNRASSVFVGTRRFWQRLTEGMELSELWTLFQAEARAGYEVYARDIDWPPPGTQSRWRRLLKLGQTVFWATVLKLSPPRRVLLLASVLLVIAGEGNTIENRPSLATYGAIGLAVILAAELADRVNMKRDLEIAREIQNWLVPADPPQVGSVDIAFATRPANTVAGDYYDAFLRPNGPGRAPDRLLFVVADVAGKGIPSALLMATFHAALRTLAEEAVSLSEMTARLNRRVCEDSSGGRRFTTAFLAELDITTGALSYLNAGHNPPLLLRASGEIEQLEPGGLPMGIQPEARYEIGATSLRTDDVLMVYTDGIVEAEDEDGNEYGFERLKSWILQTHAGSADERLDLLMRSVGQFVGRARQHDDMTCLVVRASPGFFGSDPHR